jgi:plastocyanin
MKRIYLILTIMGLILLVACGGAATQPEATVAAPAEEATAEPTDTVAPTEAATETTAPPTETATAEPTATDEPTATPEPTATTEPTTQPTATAEPTTEPTDAAPPSSAANVSIEDFQFSPANITITAGTTVRWTNLGEFRHTATADDGSFDSPTLAGGDTFEFTFTTAGTYAYYCRFHGGAGGQGMSGIVTVTE